MGTYPDVDVVTRARVGRGSGVFPRLSALGQHKSEVVLLLAGGNDVLSYADEEELRADADQAVACLSSRARLAVVAGAANIGDAPMFFWSLRGWLTPRETGPRRSGRGCSRHGPCQVDFFRATGDRFCAEPSLYFAVDGLHPSAASYRVCFDTKLRSTPFDAMLSGGIRQPESIACASNCYAEAVATTAPRTASTSRFHSSWLRGTRLAAGSGGILSGEGACWTAEDIESSSSTPTGSRDGTTIARRRGLGGRVSRGSCPERISLRRQHARARQESNVLLPPPW